TLELPKFATQMLVPSKAVPTGFLPTLNVPRIVPSLVRTLLTVAAWVSVTQRLSPSKERSTRTKPMGYWPRIEPSEGRILTNVLNPLIAQRLLPSNRKASTPCGKSYSPRMAPSLARIFDSLVPWLTHMFRPSKAAVIEGSDSA